MTKIETIIREERLDAVKHAPEGEGYFGMTVSQVYGRSQPKGLHLQRRAGEYEADLLPKAKVEMVVLDNDVAGAVQAITTTARTGEVGDGKIFVLPVYDSVRIHTGESGEDAI